jgi:hypothetical protein
MLNNHIKKRKLSSEIAMRVKKYYEYYYSFKE